MMESERYKARFVIGGHHDIRKIFMVHSAQTVPTLGIRILLMNVEMHNFDVWLDDVKQACTQTEEKIEPEVYIFDVLTKLELANEV